MIKLKLKDPVNSHINDVEKLCIILSRKNYWVYENEVREAWKRISRKSGSEWCIVPNDDIAFELLIEYFDPIKPDTKWLDEFFEKDST